MLATDASLEMRLDRPRARDGELHGLPATVPVPVYPVKVEGSGDAALILVDVS